MFGDDVILLAAKTAAEAFQHGGRVFNAAGFARSLVTLSGCSQTLDGKMVRAILSGRKDIDALPGNCHYMVREAR